MIDRGQCRITNLVKYRNVQRVAMLALDNTRNITQLCEIFQQKYIGDLRSTDVSLKTVDDSELNCRGQVDLTIRIGGNKATLVFIVIDSGSVFLLGVPTIEKLNMVIDIKMKWECDVSPSIKKGRHIGSIGVQ